MELPNIGTVLGIIYGIFAVIGLIVLFLSALCHDEAHECNLCGDMLLAEHDEWLCPACHAKLNKERDSISKISDPHNSEPVRKIN